METNDLQWENVKVLCRVRPTIDKIKDYHQLQGNRFLPSTDDCIVILDHQQLKILSKESFENTNRLSKAKLFKFNRIFNSEASQEAIYEEVAEVVFSTIQGYNSTIFAYGASGSGKTYTILGDKSNPGILPRAIEDIFHVIDNTKSQGIEALFHVEISYIELHNNFFCNLLKQVNDELCHIEVRNDGSTTYELFDDQLLKDVVEVSHGIDKVTIHESVTAGVFLSGPNLRMTVNSASDALNIILIGNKLKTLHSTSSNDVSSR